MEKYHTDDGENRGTENHQNITVCEEQCRKRLGLNAEHERDRGPESDGERDSRNGKQCEHTRNRRR